MGYVTRDVLDMHYYPAVVSNNSSAMRRYCLLLGAASSRCGRPCTPSVLHTVHTSPLLRTIFQGQDPDRTRTDLIQQDGFFSADLGLWSPAQRVTDNSNVKTRHQSSRPEKAKQEPTCRKPAARNLTGFSDRRDHDTE